MKQNSLDHLRTLTHRHQQFLLRWHERQARAAEQSGNRHKANQHWDTVRSMKHILPDPDSELWHQGPEL